MKRRYWVGSYEKWKEVVRILEASGKINLRELRNQIDTPCGHCAEHNGDCNKCSLFTKELCHNIYGRHTKYAYWQVDNFADGIKGITRRQALRFAKKILKAIEEDKPKEGAK